MGDVIMFPMHKTKAAREFKKLEADILSALAELDTISDQLAKPAPCHCVHCDLGYPKLCMARALEEHFDAW